MLMNGLLSGILQLITKDSKLNQKDFFSDFLSSLLFKSWMLHGTSSAFQNFKFVISKQRPDFFFTHRERGALKFPNRIQNSVASILYSLEELPSGEQHTVFLGPEAKRPKPLYHRRL